MTKSREMHVNVAGRYVYLEALGVRWPQVLSTLRRDVFPSYIRPVDPGHPLQAYGGLPYDQWSRVVHDHTCADLITKVEYWAEHFRIRDSWILDAAVQTMNWCRKMEDVTNCWDAWLYIDVLTPAFTPEIKSLVWIPFEHGGREPWPDFSRRIVLDLKSQLATYRKIANKHYGVGTSQTALHAAWTVLFQKGMSAADIGRSLPHQYNDPEQAVQKAINRFAKGIGLTLRA